MRNSPLAPITVWGMERSHALARSIRFPLSFLFLSSLYLFLSSRPEIKKYLISKLRARDQSLFFALPFISFFFSSFPFHLFFSPFPLLIPPLHYNEAGTTYLSTLLRLSLPLISFFSRFIHTSKTSRYW